jgi:hypothetical protein
MRFFIALLFVAGILAETANAAKPAPRCRITDCCCPDTTE